MALVQFAHQLGRHFTATLSRVEQSELGQFMTPPAIALHMAEGLVANFHPTHARVLEPAAGSGILVAAVVQTLISRPPTLRPTVIELDIFELDSRLIEGLNLLCAMLSEACAAASVELRCSVSNQDFLLSTLARGHTPIDGLLTISNPPFLKLNKQQDIRAALHSYAVYGQPNIYALFMAATARLTGPTGRWCFITPRSWMAGEYFKAARAIIFDCLQLERIHAFESRTEGFEQDSVLQETVIVWATAGNVYEGVQISRSRGITDLPNATVQIFPIRRVLGSKSNLTVSIPYDVMDRFAGWDDTLKSNGFEVSTGPVVPFRAVPFLRESAEQGTVPLLWLQHIHHYQLLWPILKKMEHVQSSAASASILLPNVPMVILRRFSPKESPRRITCTPYLGQLPGAVIGLENHLNYVYRSDRTMTVAETKGIAAYLSSRMVDEYFRALAGSTQVNAGHLRSLPMPPLDILLDIGNAAADCYDLEKVDGIVERILFDHRLI